MNKILKIIIFFVTVLLISTLIYMFVDLILGYPFNYLSNLKKSIAIALVGTFIAFLHSKSPDSVFNTKRYSKNLTKAIRTFMIALIIAPCTYLLIDVIGGDPINFKANIKDGLLIAMVLVFTSLYVNNTADKKE